jgi:multiple sugar transport system substrate-binding protein
VNTQRFLASILTCSGLLLVGCGGGEPTSDTVVIWWAQWDPAEGLDELAREFTAETGLKVEVNQIPWSDFHNQVFLEFGSDRTAFDIVIGDSQWIGRGATEGLYVELTDWLSSAVDMGTVHPRAAKYLCEYPTGSGRFYAAPCETDAVGFAYRKDWFEDPAERAAFQERYGRELTIPQSWEEFKQVAEFFTRPAENRYGCTILTGRGYDSLAMGFQHFLWDWGGDWGDPATFQVDGHVNGDAAVAGLTAMKELMQYGPPTAAIQDYARSVENFNNGSSAMSMAYFAFFPGIVKKMGEKAGFFVVPGRGEKRFISLGGQGFSISAKISDARKANAKRFIQWFLQKKIQEKWITKPAGFTANTEVLGTEAFKQMQPYNAAFAASLDHVRDFWNVPQYNELLAAAEQYVGEALDGKKTPKEALDALAAEHERIFREAGLLR